MTPVTVQKSTITHEEGSFEGLSGLRLYRQHWLPTSPPRALLLVAHGYGEHSGRYANLVDHFVPRGYAIYALDHRGHGKSEGERVYVDSFFEYRTDLKTYFDIVRAEQPSPPTYLLGHSMGALIATIYASMHQDELDGLIISGGGISAKNAPTPQPGRDLSETLSRDPAVGEAYRNDPLVFHGTPPAARVGAMAELRQQLPGMAAKISLPIIIMAGEASPLGDGPRSRALYEAVSSQDKTLKLYPDLLHEIFNEPEHPQVMADLERWLDRQVGLKADVANRR